MKQADKPKFARGEVWKAMQLKEYQRANGLCFKCGDKYVPNHVCTIQQIAQVYATEVVGDKEVLTDEMLEFITIGALQGGEEQLFLSVNVLAGLNENGTLKVQDLI
ncbi:hypothetical protein GUJ93_ZPchr0010g10317 [Zizania palustris]|uniref:Uncharacterized protein n=1 Tax=Zizania palustris TaxID=103762 RepID=A0A8J5W7E9_ZIZPA|nr:hypothetical protein GUJ93_ZPchr0010g10317 [Zizania palustris]